jgi:hypothetical protein
LRFGELSVGMVKVLVCKKLIGSCEYAFVVPPYVCVFRCYFGLVFPQPQNLILPLMECSLLSLITTFYIPHQSTSVPLPVANIAVMHFKLTN